MSSASKESKMKSVDEYWQFSEISCQLPEQLLTSARKYFWHMHETRRAAYMTRIRTYLTTRRKCDELHEDLKQHETEQDWTEYWTLKEALKVQEAYVQNYELFASVSSRPKKPEDGDLEERLSARPAITRGVVMVRDGESSFDESFLEPLEETEEPAEPKKAKKKEQKIKKEQTTKKKEQTTKKEDEKARTEAWKTRMDTEKTKKDEQKTEMEEQKNDRTQQSWLDDADDDDETDDEAEFFTPEG